MFSYILWSVALILAVRFVLRKRLKNYPPGPFALPIVGNVQLIYGDLLDNFDKLGRRYGQIFTIQMGPIHAIVLNNHDVIRKAFAEDVLCGRPTSDLIKARNGESKRGIIFNDGPQLKEIRRFVLRSLRDLGLGKSTLEESVKLEIVEISKFLKNKNGAPTGLRNMMNHATVNALWRIATGERFDVDDPVSQAWFKELTDSVQGSSLLSFFNTKLMRALYPPAKKQFDKDCALVNGVKESIIEIVRSHHNLDSQDDLVSMYLKCAEKVQSDSPFYGEEGVNNLAIVLMDLLVAGSETTATTLTWVFLLMALYPEVQKKIHKEIDELLGDRSPSIEDRPKLQYTEAAINETLRYITITPIGVAHRVAADCEFSGFFFPKDAMIISNLHAVLHDPNVWEKPNEFYPEHFLSDNKKHHDAFIPFSSGKRVCIGESLARMELFLFVASLLQEFNFELPKGVSHTIELNSSLIRGPKPYQLKITPRK